MMTNKTFHIVMVDDDPEDIFTVRRSLMSADFDCDFTGLASGPALFELLDGADIPNPDAIFLDINMPRMNGHVVLEKLQANPDWQDIPVIVLTTSDNEVDQARCLQAGATDFVTKFACMDQAGEWVKSVQSMLELGHSLNSDADQTPQRVQSSKAG